MSHFTVLVIGDNPEEQLAPYHEFECTGVDNEYVKEIDETEQYLTEYNEGTRSMYVDGKGNSFPTYDDKFYREPTEEEKEHIGIGWDGKVPYTLKDWGDGKGYRPKVKYIPEGYTEKEIPIPELYTFCEYLMGYVEMNPLIEGNPVNEEHKYSYFTSDKNKNVLKVINKTNPDSKWDWYQLGGRWAGYFKLKEIKKPSCGLKGATPQFVEGIMGEKSWASSNETGEGFCDSTTKGNIDFDSMRNLAGEEASEKYDEVIEIVGNTPVNEPWKFFLYKYYGDNKVEGYTRDMAIEEYDSQERVKTWKEKSKDPFLSVDDFNIPKEQYVANARNRACTTFAVVKDSKWYEKGEMGWWSCVTDEKEQSDWNEEFNKLIDSVPNDTLLSVYDCHI